MEGFLSERVTERLFLCLGNREQLSFVARWTD